jgi:hypothetical protein
MRLHLAAIATAVAFFLPAPVANATSVGAAAGIQQGLANSSMIEQARRVCRRNMSTGRQECWIDRSQPPTVCHWVRDRNGNMVRDCY